MPSLFPQHHLLPVDSLAHSGLFIVSTTAEQYANAVLSHTREMFFCAFRYTLGNIARLPDGRRRVDVESDRRISGSTAQAVDSHEMTKTGYIVHAAHLIAQRAIHPCTTDTNRDPHCSAVAGGLKPGSLSQERLLNLSGCSGSDGAWQPMNGAAQAVK